jgi:septal ring factor EnvC (AmiA/AmiB activator)
MGIRSLLNFVCETLVGFKYHILISLAMIAISVFVGWRWRGSVDHGEISRIQAEDHALKERLHLAQDKQGVLTEQIERLKPYTARLESEVAELKAIFAGLAGVIISQLEAISSTSASLASTVSALSEANSALIATLTPLTFSGRLAGAVTKNSSE